MFQSVFFRRLFLPQLALIVVLVLATGAFAAWRLRATYIAQRRQLLHDEMTITWDLIRRELEAGRRDSLHASLKEVGKSVDSRLTLIDASGKVLADNYASAPELALHNARPEILEARDKGEGHSQRYSETTGYDMLYMARRQRDASGEVYFLRLAVPLRPLESELRLLYGTMALAGLAALVGATVICYFFAYRQAVPIMRVTGVARQAAGGRIDPRADVQGQGEIADLEQAINALAVSTLEKQRQMTQQTDELLTIMASMGEGVVAADAQQLIVLANPAAGTLLGFDAAAAPGKALWQVIPQERLIKAARDVLESGARQSFELGIIGGRNLEVTLTRYPGDGDARGLLLVAHDTTQSVRYQELRKEFVANVSHELRTPLTVIKGFVETLRDGAMHDPVRGPDFLAKIERHTNQLTNLVNDLLELSRLESQPDMPRRVSVDLAAVARKMADLLMPAAQSKKQTLNLTAARCPLVLGNPDYLERAVANLIDNAIKYTPEGGRVDVCVSISGNGVLLEVTDNGIGIPEQDIPRIFERFYRVDRSRSREMGGTGLGLSIVKHVVQAHGGTLEVQSTLGQGSTFRFRLPAPHADNGDDENA